MKRDLIRDIAANSAAYAEREVVLGGWARSIRAGKDCGFINLNDGSCHGGVQVVFERQFVENYTEVSKYNVGTALVVRGKVVLTPDNKQPFEVKASDCISCGKCEGICPQSIKIREKLQNLAKM
jgi:asparaginyl-tRNA synthetase